MDRNWEYSIGIDRLMKIPTTNSTGVDLGVNFGDL
jgi:hypothetical protein